MATYTSNYGWTKPSGSDNVDISVLNDNLDDQDSTIHDAFLNMAPPFSESSTYAVDDIVLYTTGLYKCHTAVVTPGSWTGSTNWQVYKLSEGGGGGGTSDYSDLTNKPSINSVTLAGNKTTSDLGINADNVMLSDGTTSVEDALDDMNKSYEVIATATSTSPVDIASVNWSNYRFVTLTVGNQGGYGICTVPTCILGTTAGMCRFFKASAFGASGQYVAAGTASLGTGELTATSADYPVTLYGIK